MTSSSGRASNSRGILDRYHLEGRISRSISIGLPTLKLQCCVTHRGYLANAHCLRRYHLRRVHSGRPLRGTLLASNPTKTPISASKTPFFQKVPSKSLFFLGFL